MTARYEAIGIPVREVSLAPLRRSMNPLHHLRFACQYPSTIGAFEEIFREERTEVVYINSGIHMIAGRAAKANRIPIVWHIREIVGTNRFLAGLVSRWADRIVTNSRAVKEAFGLAEAEVIHNGIDPEEFEKGETSIRRDLPELGERRFAAIVSRVDAWKGHRVFIEAARRVYETLPEVRFLIVGGPVYSRADLYEALREEVRGLGLASVILFSGARDDVPGILRESSMAVCPSTSPEPFGRVPIEAMAASRPVIASRAGGHLETVVDGETGYLTEPGNAEEVAQRMLELFQNPDRAETLGRAGRRRVEEQFTIAVCVRKIEQVIASACTSHGTSKLRKCSEEE
jgi:glycosyltransferase involved in cell wall biosynthesis